MDYNIDPVVRELFENGAKELIAGGHHREAVVWLFLFRLPCRTVIETDASPGDRLGFAEQFDDFVRWLRLDSIERLRDRRLLAETVLGEVMDAVKWIVDETRGDSRV